MKCSNTQSDRSNGESQSELRRNEKRDSLGKDPQSENEVYLFKPAMVLEFYYDEQRVNFMLFNLNSIYI